MSFPASPSTRLQVKICGITSPEDAAAVVSSGADAVGLLVGLDHPSPDELTPEAAARIASGLPDSVTSVAVTHRVDPEGIIALCSRIGPGCVQLHGAVAPAAIPELRGRLPGVFLLKALHPEDESIVEEAGRWSGLVDGVLLDTQAEGRIGGTGRTHDWGLSAKVVTALRDFPVVLAGGLTPDNVGDAIRRVRPSAVDVNSGVRSAPGRPDPVRIAAFVEAAHAADSGRRSKAGT